MTTFMCGKYRRFVCGGSLFLFLSVIGLWSWNTLSGLLNGPQAEFKHAVAAMVLLMICGRVLHGSGRHEHAEQQRELHRQG